MEGEEKQKEGKGKKKEVKKRKRRNKEEGGGRRWTRRKKMFPKSFKVNVLKENQGIFKTRVRMGYFYQGKMFCQASLKRRERTSYR